VIDITNEDLVKSYNTIINELKSYDEDLVNKNKIIVLNKCDLLKKEEIDKIRIDFENFINLKIHLISTISGEGIDQLINEILKLKNI
jgi:GTP-binding protein